MRPLYSVPRNLSFETIDTGDGFKLRYGTAGNPEGQPVIVLHGGPGGGMHNSMFRFFHPDLFHVIAFDQRGCGGSTPIAETANNTTWHLLDDIQRLRKHLGIERWMVFGGSWGSTLALLAAQQHPEQVMSLVLRGIFLGRDSELDWFLNGMRGYFPEAWNDFAAEVDAQPGDDILGLYDRLLDPTQTPPERRLAAARAWALYETRCSTLMPVHGRVIDKRSEELALSLAALEVHYFKNNLFLDGYDILKSCARLRDIPCEIVQGRYDTVCPAISAYELHKQLPLSKLTMISNAGHSSMESGTASALISAVESLRERPEADASAKSAPLTAVC